jgi:hypothetical protein
MAINMQDKFKAQGLREAADRLDAMPLIQNGVSATLREWADELDNPTPEPLGGALVLDEEGSLWRRQANGWHNHDTGAVKSWYRLVEYHGPVKVYVEQKPSRPTVEEASGGFGAGGVRTGQVFIGAGAQPNAGITYPSVLR